MKMNKLKVGDRITYKFITTIGTAVITGIDYERGHCHAKDDEDGFEWFLEEHNVLKISNKEIKMKYKVGDRVYFQYGFNRGVGTVVKIDFGGTQMPYTVKDDDVSALTGNNYIWYLQKDELLGLVEEDDMTHFSTGAVRDSAFNKPPMDLLPWDLLPRLANWYGKGAEKYGRNNWRLGQKKSHTFSSLIRHVIKYKLGQTDEDHLAAVIWNAFSLMNVDEYLKDNEDLNDL